MKKRLLFLISRFLDGGIDMMLVEYLNNIDYSRYEVTVVIGMAMKNKEVHLHKLPPQVKVVHLIYGDIFTHVRRKKLDEKVSSTVRLFDEMMLTPLRHFVALRRLRRLIAAHDAVIDFDATFYTMLHECESVINGKPVVGFYHFSIEENLRRAERHTRRQMLGMAGYSNIVVISDTMLDEGRRLFPELSDKFVRIFNGFNLEELRRRAAASNPKDEGATPLSSPYLVSVARLEESQKDITTLIRAYARLKSMMEAMPTEARLPDLVLVGDGRDRDALEALARELKVATKVHFMGFQSDSMPWIGHSEALVLSSKYEGFGLVLVEAMSVGTPVVATNCPSGPAEILEHGASGLLVPVGDEVTMAQNLLHLIVDAEFRAKMGEEALRRSADFDIRLSVAQLMNLVK